MALTDEGLIDQSGTESRWVRLGGGPLARYMTADSSGPADVDSTRGCRARPGPRAGVWLCPS